MNDGQEVKVTVICIIYNQEQYLQKCLDGLAEQKTNFPFEVILHDDASTDGSVEIINKYCEKYKGIFVPILQKTNQYSKKIPFFNNLLNKAKGEYIALCEGDDYWCDPYKLQKQYDFMEAHSECSICVHNTLIHDLNDIIPDVNFMKDEGCGEWGYLNEKQIFNYWIVHYSSYFIRNNYDIIPDEWSDFFWARDYVMLTVAYAHGKIGVLNHVMSVYNSNNPEGLTAVNARSSDSMKKIYDRAIYLKDYLMRFPDISDAAKKAIHSRINAIEENKMVNDFCNILLAIGDSSDKSDEEKFEWLVNALNDEKLFKICTNPSDGIETLNSSKQIFRAVDVFCNGLHGIMDAIHFTFVPWISFFYQSDIASKEYLLAIAASPENLIGWGIKLDGDFNRRRTLVLQYADEKKLTDELKKELNIRLRKAIECVDKDDIKNGLREVNLALKISPLNRNLICYKAFILLLLREKNACLNEIGIYNLFYDIDEDIGMIYEKLQTL